MSDMKSIVIAECKNGQARHGKGKGRSESVVSVQTADLRSFAAHGELLGERVSLLGELLQVALHLALGGARLGQLLLELVQRLLHLPLLEHRLVELDERQRAE